MLRRIAHALREQNWATIVIEFVLLVCGVFFGIQAANWNDARRDHHRERAYLGRIAAELDEGVLKVEQGNALTLERMALDQLLIDSVAKPDLVRADPGRFIYAVTRGGYTFSPNVNGYTFEEIKSNGDLGIFKDPRLPLDLMTFYSGIQQKGQWSFLRSQSQFEYIRRSAGVLDAEQLALVPDASRRIHTDDVGGAMAAYQRMLDRPEFLEWVPITLDYRRTDLEYGKEILKAAQDLRDRVRAELGQPPLPRDAAQSDTAPQACPDLTGLKATTERSADPRPEEMAADKLVAEAKAITRSMSDVNLTKAMALYEQALQADPQNAAAHIGVAGAHLSSRRYLSVSNKIAQARAREYLAKGRAIEPGNIDGLYLLADQVFLANRDYGCTLRIFETALRLDPENARTHYWLSELLSGMGQFDLAFEHAGKALALADADTRDYIERNNARQRYMAGQYDWVIDHYTTYLQTNPGYSLAHFYRSLAHGAKGEFDTALAEAKLSRPDAPKGDAGGIGMLALAYANAGQKDKARELLQELLDRDARGEHVVEYRIAAVYEVLGERDLALTWLDKQIDDREGVFSWLLWLNHDPVWTSMRKDPRFKGIQQRAGWKETLP